MLGDGKTSLACSNQGRLQGGGGTGAGLWQDVELRVGQGRHYSRQGQACPQ